MRSQTIRKNEREGPARDRWLISYADLVTLLLALFIVMYAASDKERARQIAESFSSQSTGGSGILPGHDSENNLNAKVDQALRSSPVLIQKTKMRETRSGFVVSLSEAGFFASGDATTNAEADDVIRTLSDALRDSDARIRIEGHTDSTPISSSRYPSNWELSTARASSVLAKLIDGGIAPERLSAAGYAGFQPIADNAKPEGRAQNRRVDVVVLNP